MTCVLFLNSHQCTTTVRLLQMTQKVNEYRQLKEICVKPCVINIADIHCKIHNQLYTPLKSI